MSPACYSNVIHVGKVAIWLLWSRSTHCEHTGMINQSNNCSFTGHKGSVNGSKIKMMWTVQCCAIVYLYTTVCEYNAWKPQGDLDLKLRPVTKSHIIGFTGRGPMSISSPSVVPSPRALVSLWVDWPWGWKYAGHAYPTVLCVAGLVKRSCLMETETSVTENSISPALSFW